MKDAKNIYFEVIQFVETERVCQGRDVTDWISPKNEMKQKMEKGEKVTKYWRCKPLKKVEGQD